MKTAALESALEDLESVGGVRLSYGALKAAYWINGMWVWGFENPFGLSWREDGCLEGLLGMKVVLS